MPVTNVTVSANERLTLERVTRDFSHLPPLPEVLSRLMTYFQGGGDDVRQLVVHLSQDPVLAARVLRVANSSLYGLSRRVSTLQDAVSVVGLAGVQSIIVAAAMAVLFQSLEETLAESGHDPHAFWRHSIGAALCARLIARQTGAPPEAAFIAGLLHDMGYLILAARFSSHHVQLVQYRELRDCHRYQAEMEWLGFSHAQIGAAFADRWNFPIEIHDAITYHHSPENSPLSVLPGVTHVADAMAHILNFDGRPRPLAPDISETVWQHLGLDWTRFKSLLGEAEQQFSEMQALFH